MKRFAQIAIKGFARLNTCSFCLFSSYVAAKYLPPHVLNLHFVFLFFKFLIFLSPRPQRAIPLDSLQIYALLFCVVPFLEEKQVSFIKLVALFSITLI